MILLPIAISDGAQFTIGARLFAGIYQDNAISIGRVYILEALGSIIGGIILTYGFIPHFSTISTALIVSFFNLLSAGVLLIVFRLKNKNAN